MDLNELHTRLTLLNPTIAFYRKIEENCEYLTRVENTVYVVHVSCSNNSTLEWLMRYNEITSLKEVEFKPETERERKHAHAVLTSCESLDSLDNQIEQLVDSDIKLKYENSCLDRYLYSYNLKEEMYFVEFFSSNSMKAVEESKILRNVKRLSITKV